MPSYDLSFNRKGPDKGYHHGDFEIHTRISVDWVMALERSKNADEM